MIESTLFKAMAEARRFLEKAEILLECTAVKNECQYGHYTKEFGHDSGLRDCRTSKTRAAVLRSCIDLRNALSDVTQGR